MIRIYETQDVSDHPMTPMNYKLTIDVNLMDEGSKIPAMDTLKRWKREGKIELIEAAPSQNASYGWPGSTIRTSPSRDPRGRTRMKKDPPGSPNFKTVAGVLFPSKDFLKLNMGEINDVAHLVKHCVNKNEFFITVNMKDFIESGRRETLKQSLGIIAMTPDEVVEALAKIEGWK